MTAITKAQQGRIRDIRMALMLGGERLESLVPAFSQSDVKMLIDRIDDLGSEDNLLGADNLIWWAYDRLQEDLNEKRDFLRDAVEQVRIAELQVREAEHALAGVKALKDGGIYASGDEINTRWDAVEALYVAQGMYPPNPEAQEFAQPTAPEPPPPEPMKEEVQAEPEEPRETRWDAKTREREPMTPEQQDAAMLAALKVAAGDKLEIQVSTAVLAAASGVPNGSTLTSLRRMESAGLIEIIGDKPEKGAPRPNIYRFKTPEAQAKTSSEPPETPAEPVTQIVERVAEAQPEAAPTALGEAFIKAAATVKKAGAPKKSDDRPVRDRILHTLKSVACTTSGLASMLDVKELAVCQALEAMKHEGVVTSDEMPEAGRRAQLWRLPVAELSPS